MSSDLPPLAVSEICEVLRWFDAHPQATWNEMGALYDTYCRWRDIIRQKDKDMTDGLSTMQTVPGLSSFGRVFLLEHLSEAEQTAKPKPTNEPRTKRATVNERMAAMLQEDPTRINWSAKKWAETFNVTDAAVKQTTTWKRSIRAARALTAPERAEIALKRAGRDIGR